eukprot:GILK01009729.1.p1 GENE.GILK01009729.1~~GILK01009729.1.p1  ORF type:complete len:335 (+),score=28.17 GILK01009729.1:46-1005(+)
MTEPMSRSSSSTSIGVGQKPPEIVLPVFDYCLPSQVSTSPVSSPVRLRAKVSTPKTGKSVNSMSPAGLRRWVTASAMRERTMSDLSTQSPFRGSSGPIQTEPQTVSSSPNSSEPPVCRICLENDTQKKLISPCKCSGSMRWIHEDCLKQWLASQEDVERGRMIEGSQCEICHTPFQMELEQKTVCLPFGCCDARTNKAQVVFAPILFLVAGLLGLVIYVLAMKYSSSATSGEKTYTLVLLVALSASAFLTLLLAFFSLRQAWVIKELISWTIFDRSSTPVEKIDPHLQGASAMHNESQTSGSSADHGGSATQLPLPVVA